jgi:hypothetical protein
MEAKNILDAMLENYVSCSSYEDVGRVVDVEKTTIGEKVTTGKFNTTFIRPSLLTFNLESENQFGSHRFRLQSDGESIRAMDSRISTDGEQKLVTQAYPSLPEALYTKAGSTLGTTSLTFGLLNVINMLYDIRNAENIERLDDEVLDGISCYRLAALINSLVRYESDAWIATDTFHLVRFELRTVLTEEFRGSIKALAKTVLQAEGITDDGVEAIGQTQTTHYERVVFNNSITIDKIVDNQF